MSEALRPNGGDSVLGNERALAPLTHPRTLGWKSNTAMAMGGSNQMLFLLGALIAANGTAAIPLLIVGLALSWAAMPGWTELVLMFPDRVGGIAASCSEAFKPYSRVLANLAGTCYWWGWIPTCGLTALLSASAIHDWYLPGIPVTVLAATFVLLFSLLNLSGLHRTKQVTSVIAVASGLLAFAAAIIPIASGRVDWHQATSFTLRTPFSGPFGQFTSAMAGLYLVGFAAPAFEAAACHVGETVDPGKNIPKAMYASALMATLYFAVLPIIFLGVIGSTGVRGDLANTLGPTFAPVFGSAAKAVAVWFMVLNMFHGTITPLAGVARTLAQLSEDGLIPRSFAKRNRHDVPWVAVLTTAGFAIAFLIGGDPVWVLAAANFTYLIGIALPSVAVWLLRRHEPDRVRLYRAPKGTIVLGLIAASVWGLTIVFGFQQFGLPTVLAGLALAYSGACSYAWRQWKDRQGIQTNIRRSLQVKLTGTMLAVLLLDGAGYLLAIHNIRANSDPGLSAALQDIFVVVAILTIAVGLILPGMISHGATAVAQAAQQLVTGSLADLTRAMVALASGDLDNARASISTPMVDIRSHDEIRQIGESLNKIIDESSLAVTSLDGAREALLTNKRELVAYGQRQTALAELARFALNSTDFDKMIARAVELITDALPGEHCEFLRTAALLNLDSSRGLLGKPHAMLIPIRCSKCKCGVLRITPESESEIRTARLSPSTMSWLDTMASIIGSVVDRIHAQDDLHHQASHDPLTGLPNRSLLTKSLSEVLSSRRGSDPSIAVMFLDIDRFKMINDSLGHEHGDALLRILAKRFSDVLRPGDVVARFGGDEFVLLVQAQNEIEARVISARIQSCAREPISLNGRDYSASLSIGIAMGTGAGQTSADLLRDADAAMYRAKATGKGRSVVFDYWMRDEAMLRMDLVADLRFALANYQLHVYYQPIVDLTTGIPTSVEALVRWEHPTKGLIKPDVFIPLAEEHDLISALDEFVMQEACTFIGSIRASQPFLENLCVAVNISGRHIADHGLVERVASVLAQTQLAPECLTLELTESTLMKDTELSTRALTKLKELGIRLSIDDFGTGYSSLSYLQNFPLDCLKVDRSFTARLGRDDDSEPIVRATISIAQALGLEIVAEGIEDLEQAEFLRDAGCQKAQGYLFSRPVSKQSLVSTLLGLTVSAVK